MKSLIALLIVAVLSVIFTLQNAHAVDTKALFWTFTSPLAIVIVVSLLLGVAMGIGVSLVSLSKKKGDKDIKRKEEAKKETESQTPPPAQTPSQGPSLTGSTERSNSGNSTEDLR